MHLVHHDTSTGDVNIGQEPHKSLIKIAGEK